VGSRGPVPKRTSQRLGHLTKAEKSASTVVEVVGGVTIPAADASWHAYATAWYKSLSESGQVKQMEPSDWAAAQVVAGELTRMLGEELPNAAMFRAVWSAMNDLMTTEGARRRLKVEVNRRQLSAVAAPVAKLDDFRAL
jgi:hypothetical protein